MVENARWMDDKTPTTELGNYIDGSASNQGRCPRCPTGVSPREKLYPLVRRLARDLLRPAQIATGRVVPLAGVLAKDGFTFLRSPQPPTQLEATRSLGRSRSKATATCGVFLWSGRIPCCGGLRRTRRNIPG
jgi:hypothetical protein